MSLTPVQWITLTLIVLTWAMMAKTALNVRKCRLMDAEDEADRAARAKLARVTTRALFEPETDPRIGSVFRFPNGNVAVCDRDGKQMEEYQGSGDEAWWWAIRAAPMDAEIMSGPRARALARANGSAVGGPGAGA